MLEQLFQSSGPAVSILLVAALIVALVVAFKIMEMVFETVIVTVLSGVFYIALRYIQEGAISLNDVLLFAFLGAALYMLYSLLASLYSVGATVIPLPFKVIKMATWPFREAWERYEEHQKRKSYVDRDKESNNEKEDEDEKSTKEVILGKNQENDED